MLNTLAYIFLQALSPGSNKMVGGDVANLGGDFKTIGAGIVATGMIFAGMAVVRKLANNSDDAKKALIGWFVAAFVFYGIWKLL